jgi:mannose-6-phosphate isomerase-like protein (cupin superfamily)
MSHPTADTPDEAGREFVLGRELRATILTVGAETGGRHDLTLGTTPPGSTTPLHLHTRYDERLWVISGRLTVWAGADRVILRSGDYYAIPMNTPHMIETGPDGARALNITSPAGFAELIARTATPARLAGPETELDADLFMAVTTELGDLVLGPPGTVPAEAEVNPGPLDSDRPEG